jgi:hypothetical protein
MVVGVLLNVSIWLLLYRRQLGAPRAPEVSRLGGIALWSQGAVVAVVSLALQFSINAAMSVMNR